jgi:hypothetical protein
MGKISGIGGVFFVSLLDSANVGPSCTDIASIQRGCLQIYHIRIAVEGDKLLIIFKKIFLEI